jgi:hypothetical protein
MAMKLGFFGPLRPTVCFWTERPSSTFFPDPSNDLPNFRGTSHKLSRCRKMWLGLDSTANLWHADIVGLHEPQGRGMTTQFDSCPTARGKLQGQ